MKQREIILKKVRVHNLKGIDLTLHTNELILFTGVSGSGKSSLAFDTLFVEGQRRYIESLSAFARRYLGDLSKPDVESVSGLSPTIAIEQKSAGKNPRSTVGTLTEIYDYLRVLFARIGIPHCPVSGEPVRPQSRERIIKTIQAFPGGEGIVIFSPIAKGKKGEFKDDFQFFLRKGFTRARVDGVMVDLSEELSLEKNLTHDIDLVIDRVTVLPENQSRIAESVLLGLEFGSGIIVVLNEKSGNETLFSTHAYSPKSGLYYSALEPHDFSFNSPTGMCTGCHGLGVTLDFDLDKIIDPNKSIADDCCSIASSYKTVKYGNIYDNLARMYDFDVHTPWKNLPERAGRVFLFGTEKKWIRMHFIHPTRDLEWSDTIQWRGVLHEAKQRYAEAQSDRYRKKMESLMREMVCPACLGARLRPYPAATTVGDLRIYEITSLPIEKSARFFETLKLDKEERVIAQELLHEIKRRLQFLLDVGLHYLSLDRRAPTLSGGESQRVRLASHVGAGLVGVTYILDEPSIGLHPRDNRKLIDTLKRLRDVGNTVIVVEHDEETIFEADRIVDFGPGPGEKGGEIVVNGTLRDLFSNPRSLTGSYLSRKREIPVPKVRRKASKKETIRLEGASHHNLKHISVDFPLGVMIAITGVSGSGKSSLITDTLYPALANHLHHAQHPVGKYRKITGIDKIDKVIAIDQSPIGRTPRSNPATYIKFFDEIRSLFSQLPDSRARGYSPGRFSFNVRDGACLQCHGMGMIRIDMDFLEDQWVQCQMCKSKRFDNETLSIFYKGKNIADVLEMSVEEARVFFENIPHLKRRLEVVGRVGMDYIRLGQPSTTLSGGEAQRIKLAKELVRPGTGKTFYILDEPTTGLHAHDILALLSVLHELVERGNTVLIIEHNMEVVKTADWIIDLGPEGGEAGGKIVAFGTPEKIASLDIATGKALKKALHPRKPKLEKKKPEKKREVEAIAIKGAEQNNLKHLDLSFPREKITVCTGPSGSGKSSLAFDTVYAEGQRRYIETLTSYARQFVRQMPKAKVSEIDGLSPAVAIEQKQTAGNPRSTVGTMTEIYDYLRILYAQAGIAYSPETGKPIRAITKDLVVEKILSLSKAESILILAPLILERHEKFDESIARFKRLGYLRIRIDKEIHELDAELPYDRRRKQEIALVIDRLRSEKENQSRLFGAVEQASMLSGGKVLVVHGDEETLFSLTFSDETTGKSYPAITPHTFSFNSPEGMCPECQGLGYQYGANLTKNPMIMNLSIQGLLRTFWSFPHVPLFERFLKRKAIDLRSTLNDLTAKQLQLFLSGSAEDEWIESKEGFRFRWLGIQPLLAKAGKLAYGEIKESLIPLLDEIECFVCHGSRLNPLARNVKLNGYTLPELCKLSIEKAHAFLRLFKSPKQLEKILEEVMKQLVNRSGFLLEVGLEYLSLDRRAPTLSNGEAQRIRLARQLGSQLTGVLYVLDEPTIGLHPHDNARLNFTLAQLRKLGNTLLMVEHDPQTIAMADYILDFGPGAGIHGGHLIAEGTYEEILTDPKSLTGAYLTGRKKIEISKKIRTPISTFRIENAKVHNLKDLSFELPLGVLCCLTGVSGSGKSTLMHDVIRSRVEEVLENSTPFEKVIVIDQNPIGHTVRADVGTYVDLLAPLREFYASLAASRVKGLTPSHFSYNHRKGMCSHCWGLGYKKVEMLFLPAVKVTCDQCKGLRLNPVSLSVLYHGKNFGQLLGMTIEDILSSFGILRKPKRICEMLISVGLGYLQVGQEIVSLSGGEAQRVKLTRELSRRGHGNTLYLLDEPTTGLHFADIQKLLEVLNRLVDKGNTILVIEHNLEVIKNCDYIIDLGPGAGEKGGEIIGLGTPKELARNPHSITGKYLKQLTNL